MRNIMIIYTGYHKNRPPNKSALGSIYMIIKSIDNKILSNALECRGQSSY